MSENGYRNLKKTNKLMIPVILMMGFVPLLVHMYSYNSNLSQFDWFPANSDTQTDFFFAWKMIAIVIIGVVMAAILLYRHYVKKETLQFENSFYFLLVYGLFVLMSALFSKYKHWVSGGTYELFESVWVVFAYMLLCYYVYNFVNFGHWHGDCYSDRRISVFWTGFLSVKFWKTFDHKSWMVEEFKRTDI